MSAFARSRPLMARYDVSPHLTKWWKGVRPDDGQVSCKNFGAQLINMCFAKRYSIGEYCLKFST